MTTARQRQGILCVVTLLTATCLFLVGCETSSSSSAVESADLELSVSPDPVTAHPSSGVFTVPTSEDEAPVEYQWKATFTLTLTETEGVGGDVTAVTAAVATGSGGIQVGGSGRVEYLFMAHTENTRFEANDSIDIGTFDVYYWLSNGGHEALVTVTISVEDDNEWVQSQAIKVQVE